MKEAVVPNERCDTMIKLIYCGEDEPTDECERVGYCRYHNGDLKPGDWDLVDYHYGPIGGGTPLRTTVQS